MFNRLLAPRLQETPRIEYLEARIAPAAIGSINWPTPARVEIPLPEGIVGAPSLHVDLTDNVPRSAAHGSQIVYTLSYTNTGTVDADVTLTEQPDPHTFFNSFLSTPGWTFNVTTSQYELHVGNVPAGGAAQTATFVVSTPIFAPTSLSAVQDQATITLTAKLQGGTPPAPGESASDTQQTAIYQGIEVFTPGVSTSGHYANSQIRIVDLSLKAAGRPAEIKFDAYGSGVRDSFRTAVGDFDDDGFDDVLVIPEHGTAPVRVFDGTSGELMDSPLNNVRPFGARAGGFVAIGDLQIGAAFLARPREIPFFTAPKVAFGSSLGGGAVEVYDSLSGEQIEPTFYPFGRNFRGGVRVAIGDVDGDGIDDLIASQGNFGNTVKVYGGGDQNNLLGTFQVGGRFRGGLNVSVGDLDNDGRAEIVAGHNTLSAPTVEIFKLTNGANLAPNNSFERIASFNAFNAAYRGGVRVAVADVDLDGAPDVIAAVGFNGKSQVRVFGFRQPSLSVDAGSLPAPTVIDSFTAFPTALLPGVWVSASIPVPFISPRPV